MIASGAGSGQVSAQSAGCHGIDPMKPFAILFCCLCFHRLFAAVQQDVLDQGQHPADEAQADLDTWPWRERTIGMPTSPRTSMRPPARTAPGFPSGPDLHQQQPPGLQRDPERLHGRAYSKAP